MAAEAALSTRERNKLKRRERILDAACELLREEPDKPWTVERIARRAGVVPATVFNLIGTRDDIWAALANRKWAGIDVDRQPQADPRLHAREVVDDLMRSLIADAPVFRALIVGWSQSASHMHHDPTHIVLESLRAAERSGDLLPGTDAKRLAAHVGTAINGALHQWAAGVIGDRTLRARCADAIDIAFTAARRPDAPPSWELQGRAGRSRADKTEER
jgi:AcrR family transcriptional regulator